MVELSELASRPTSQNWPRRKLPPRSRCELRARGLPPTEVLRVQILLSQGIAFAGPHSERGPSAHVSAPPTSENQMLPETAEVQPLSSRTFYKWHGCGCWVEAAYTGDPSCTYNGVYVSTWHICRVKLAQRGRGQSKPG